MFKEKYKQNKIWEVLRKLLLGLLGLDEVKELELGVIMAKFKMEVGELELVC